MNETVLSVAVKHGHEEVVKTLLKHGADVNSVVSVRSKFRLEIADSQWTGPLFLPLETLEHVYIVCSRK